MKIEILYLDGCPNYLPAVDRLQKVLQNAGLAEDVSKIEVKDATQAAALEFSGSPTIRVNGIDIESAARGSANTGVACRLYPGGLPSEEMIRAALEEARELKKQ